MTQTNQTSLPALLSSHALSTQQKIRLLNDRSREIILKRADAYRAAMKRGVAVDSVPFVDDDEREARAYAKTLLNGDASALSALPPSTSEDKMLARELRGIELALVVLGKKELAERSAAAAAWEDENRSAWSQKVKQILIAFSQLEALKREAREMLDTCPDLFAINLPVGIASRYLKPTNDADFAFDELLAAARAEGIITAADIRRINSAD